MSQRETLDVHEEETLVAKHESLLSSTHPGIRVSEASLGVVGVSAAPCLEVCAVHTSSLNQSSG